MTSIEKEKRKAKKVINTCKVPCQIERGMTLLGGKWKATILWHLKDGPVRFNDLARQLNGASKKMITQRLKEMEEAGMIKRCVVSTKPLAVTYQLTEFGTTALKFLKNLESWMNEQGL